jgi:hypothetical protein
LFRLLDGVVVAEVVRLWMSFGFEEEGCRYIPDAWKAPSSSFGLLGSSSLLLLNPLCRTFLLLWVIFGRRPSRPRCCCYVATLPIQREVAQSPGSGSSISIRLSRSMQVSVSGPGPALRSNAANSQSRKKDVKKVPLE